MVGLAQDVPLRAYKRVSETDPQVQEILFRKYCPLFLLRSEELGVSWS